MPPRVSIILNIYNGSATLAETLDSVFAQTYHDWELIAWDDCSTDSSQDVVAQRKDARVRYILSPERVSLGRARDKAIREARGEWLAFLDQDDTWIPSKLADQLAIGDLDTTPHVGFVYGRTLIFGAEAERDYDHRHEYRPLPEGWIFEDLFKDSCFIAMSSLLFRKSLFYEIGGIPDEFEVVPDYYLLVAGARRYPVRVIQWVICKYRVHAGAMSRRRGPQIQCEAMAVVRLWAHCLDSDLVRRRLRIHSSVLAFYEMLHISSFGRGIARLLREGSAGYLASRPAAITWRRIRRKIARPFHRSVAPVTDVPSPPSRGDKLSIIIVNWNVRALLQACLQSVIEQARQSGIDWELLVVDNASTDGSAAMVRHAFPEAVLFANDDNVGFARANNQAFVHANGNYVLLLNPDTVVSQDALTKLLANMRQRPDAAAIGCRMVDGTGALLRWTGGAPPTLGTIASHFLFFGRLFPNRRFFRSIYLNGDPTTDSDVGWVSGACMLLRRDALGTSIFDERFFLYGEDIDLCLRLRARSWKIVYSPRATIVHYDGSSLKRQSAGVDLNKLRNLRHIFAARHGNLQLAIYDGIVCLGFLARSFGFAAAAVAHPRRGYQRDAKRSVRYLAESIRAMVKTPGRRKMA